MRRLSWLLFAALLAVPGGAAVGPAPRATPAPMPEPVAATADALPTAAEMESLARTDPTAFPRACVRAVPEAGGAECYVLRRTCDPPEEDGVVTVEIAVDTEHWLQVANVLTAAGGRRVGAYYFRDLVLNPEFPPGQFEKAALLAD